MSNAFVVVLKTHETMNKYGKVIFQFLFKGKEKIKSMAKVLKLSQKFNVNQYSLTEG